MYINDSFLDSSFIGFEFQTEDHRKVADNMCLSNPKIDTKDDLINATKIVNSIPKERIKEITIAQFIDEFKFPY